jgi:hypothetical protein
MKDKNTEKRIESKDGKLFCMYRIAEDGSRILVAKNCEILLDELLQQVYNRERTTS